MVTQGFGLIQAANSNADRSFYDLINDQVRLSFRRTDLELSSIDDARRQAHLDLMSESAVSTGFLVYQGAGMSDPRLVGIVEGAYITASNRLRHSAEYLQQNHGRYLDPELISLTNALLETGDSVFADTLDLRRRLISTERALLVGQPANSATAAGRNTGVSDGTARPDSAAGSNT